MRQGFARLGLAGVGVLAAIFAPARAAEEPILIGAHLDVAKQASYYSLNQKDAIEAFVAAKNAEGGIRGRPLRVIFEDDELNPTVASQKVEKLAALGAVAILSISGSAPGFAAQAKGEELKIPVFSGNTAERLTTQPPKRYYFRTGLRDSVAGQALSDFIKGRKEGARVAVVRDSTETGLLVSDAYIAALRSSGVQIVGIEQITPGSSDVTAQALSVRRSAADFVLLSGASIPDLANYVKTHVSLGIKAQLLGTFVVASPNFLPLAGQAAQGLVFPDTVDFSRPEVVALTDRLVPKLGAKTKSFSSATQTWEMMRLITEAMERGGITRETLRDEMEQTRSWPTLYGPAGNEITMSPEQHDVFTSSRQVVLRQIWDGTYRTYK